MISNERPAGGMRTTITISRQMGSLGLEVGRLAAESLGYRMVWREVINQAARIAGSPEAALATIDELGLIGLSPSPKAYQEYRRAVQDVIEELAGQGRVIVVGRAGQAILAGRLDVLHVKVIAPITLRAERIAARQGITLEGAEAQIRASDKHRRRYLRRYYNLNWDDPGLYDLTISTASFSAEEAAQVICKAATTGSMVPEADLDLAEV